MFEDNASQLAFAVTMRSFTQLVLSACVIISMFWPYSRPKLLWSLGLVVNYAAILSLAASFSSSLPTWTTLFAIGVSTSTALWHAALLNFDRRPLRYRKVLLGPVACLAAGIWAFWQFDIAVFVLYAINAAQFLVLGVLAWRVSGERSRAGGRGLLAAGCILAGGAAFSVALGTLVQPDRYVLQYGVMVLGTAMAMIMQNLGWLALQKDNAEIQLERLAHVDGLTGLLNRRGFASESRRLIRALRRHGKPVSVLLVDIDHFKSVNDRWGHDAGDTILADVGAMLLLQLRGDDLVCRLGGEEFVMVLQDTTPHSAHLASERLREAMADQVRLPDGTPVRFSAGIAAYDVSETDFDGAIARADRALYEAKASGRDCAVISAGIDRLAA